jgi:hypothetical protein
LPADTVRIAIPPEGVVTDTLPRDTLRTGVPDTLRPAPHIPRFPQAGVAGWAEGRWVWEREDLLRFHNLSLVELLERIPGLVVTRAGGSGAPSGAAAFGQGGGRVRVFRDGFEVDPLGTATLDLQQVGIIDLDRLTVERSLAETRIHLRTFQLRDMRPFSELELGTGNFQARFLRALFVRPFFGDNVLSAAFDLSNAGGYRLVEPSGFTTARVRWDRPLGPRSGVQLEYLLGTVSRESAALPADFERREVVLRGRTRLGEALHLEGTVGRATYDPARQIDPLSGRPISGGDPAVDTLDLPASSTQFAARALWQREFGFAEGSARGRVGGNRGFGAPGGEVSARVGLRPLAWLASEGLVRTSTTSGGSATEMEAILRAGPVGGISLFGALSAGDRWETFRRDNILVLPDTVTGEGVPVPRYERETRFSPIRSGVAGTRFGGEFASTRFRLSGAMLGFASTTVVPFALGFDRALPPQEVGAATGFETRAWVAAPGALEGLTLDGWYIRFTDTGGRPYLPEEEGAAALTFTGTYLEDHFEPTARLEATYRGGSLAPAVAGETLVAVQPYAMLNFALQLRILDVRAFFVYENILNELEAAQIPGRLLPSARTLYGIRWFFRN